MIKRSALGSLSAPNRAISAAMTLGGARAAVVAFDRDASRAQATRRNRHSRRRPSQTRARRAAAYFRAEAAGAGDIPRMRRAGGTQPRRRLGALGRKPVARAKARKTERQMLERHSQVGTEQPSMPRRSSGIGEPVTLSMTALISRCTG